MKNIRFKLLAPILCLFFAIFCPIFISAKTLEPLPEQTTRDVQTDKSAAQIDSEKLEVAKNLTTWVQKTLQEKEAVVAVVARKGGKDIEKRDKTGMAHSGFAVYDPRVKTWIVYDLSNSSKGSNPQSVLQRRSLLDFFYGQTGYKEDALILFLDKETQNRVYESILNGNYKKVFFTTKYNLLSRYDSSYSLNCNKWLLMVIAAARIDDYNHEKVLESITNGFEPGRINLSMLEKMVAKKKDNVRANEIPSSGPILTVTIESLYNSPIFEGKEFYAE